MQARLHRVLLVLAVPALLELLGRCSGSANTTSPSPTEAPVGSEEWAHQVAGAARCKILFTSAYGYRQFFPLVDAASRSGKNPMDGYPAPPVSSSTRPPAPEEATTLAPSAAAADPQTRASASSQRLLLRFEVMAESDAHILISAQRRSDRDAYEVVLGAGANSYTDFRRLPASIPPRRAFNYSVGVVSGSELRAFWLLADLGTGLLAVGPVGGAPILSWVDPDPVQVRYFSLCTWTDVLGTWLYGCDDSVAEPLDAEGMPPAARVHQNIVTPAKMHSPPRAPVDSYLLVNHLIMDDKRGIASLFGTIRLEWHDERLAWTPGNFSGLNSTRLSPEDVWTPGLQLLDPVGRTDLLSSGDAVRLVLQSSGNLSYQFGVRLRAWCSLQGASDYTCTLRLGTRAPAKLRRMAYSLLQGARLRSDWDWADALTHASQQEDPAAHVLQLHVRHRGSRLSCVFMATYLASVLCSVLCVFHSMLGCCPSSLGLDYSFEPLLLGSLCVLFQAASLVSLHAALPSAVMAAAPAGVLCLSGSLLTAALGMLCPRLLMLGPGVGDDDSAVYTLLHRCLHSRAGRLLLQRDLGRERSRWRESPSTTEQALEMLKALDKEQAARDWSTLSALLYRMCSVVCLGLTAAAGIVATYL